MSRSPSLPQLHSRSFPQSHFLVALLSPVPRYVLWSFLPLITPVLSPAWWSHPWFLQTVLVTSPPVPSCSLTPWLASQLQPCREGSSQVLTALPGLRALPRCLHSVAIPFYRMFKTLILPSPTCSQLWLKLPVRSKVVWEERQADSRA